MSTESKKSENSCNDQSICLVNLHDDAIQYLLSFLRGRDMARMECVCKRMQNGNMIEIVARREFIKYHPHLSPELLKAHQKYCDMISSSFKYCLHSSLCYPTANELNPEYNRELRSRTDYRYLGHIDYMLEKVFGRGNIILLVNTIKFFKKYINIDLTIFCKRLMKYGDQLPTSQHLWNEFNANRYGERFTAETKLYLLKYHRQDLIIGDHFDELLHAFMIECCENGLTDIAVECRRMGAKIKPEMEGLCKIFFEQVGHRYWLDYIWMDLKDPGMASNELLQKQLDSRVAIFSIGEIEEWEKLHDLSLITDNQYYSPTQMFTFLKQLLQLNAVSDSIKESAQQWIK